MTIDDDNSVYVGGLPYDANEESIRRVFNLYGAVVAVKIINDHGTRGKCYGFVTFTNPRSAVDAINDMNGRTIDGRVVRVNEVTTRGGKSNLNRERFRHNMDRGVDWDRGRDRERNYDRGKDRHQDRYSDRSRERDRSWERDEDRERVHERALAHDGVSDHFLDRNRDQDRVLEDSEQEHSRNHGRDWERDPDVDWDQDKGMNVANGYHRSIEIDKDQRLRKQNGSTINDQHRKELSSDTTNDCNYLVKEELERSIQKREALKKEISQMQKRLEEKQQLVSDLQKKSKKMEDALITAKKHSSLRQLQLTRMHKCFLQVKEYSEKLKSSEKELQTLVDSAMIESDDGDDVAARDGIMKNGYP